VILLIETKGDFKNSTQTRQEPIQEFLKTHRNINIISSTISKVSLSQFEIPHY